MFRYGTRAVVYLAAVYPHRAVSVREIAEDQRTSRKYLEHILQILKTAGLVQSVQGKHGGYVLARSPDRITLKDLYEYMVGSLAPVNCVDQPESCPRRDDCPTWETWVEVKEAVESVLDRTTVQHLLDRKKRKAISLEPVARRV